MTGKKGRRWALVPGLLLAGCMLAGCGDGGRTARESGLPPMTGPELLGKHYIETRLPDAWRQALLYGTGSADITEKLLAQITRDGYLQEDVIQRTKREGCN